MGDTRTVSLSLVLEANGDDGYLASAPGIQGAFVEGNTIEEALFNCIDVVKMISAYRVERGESSTKNLLDGCFRGDMPT